jgi:5-methylcytosine-specific restriction endonuclease McrA
MSTVAEAIAAVEAERQKRAAKAEKSSEKRIKSFYNSWQWKKVRYEFLKGKARRCQCCGSTPAQGERIVVDHVKPLRHFWHLRLDPNNLEILCDSCNRGKGSYDTTDWRASDEGKIADTLSVKPG